MGRDSSSHATNSAQSNDDERDSRRPPEPASSGPGGCDAPDVVDAPGAGLRHPASIDRGDESERAGQDERRRGWFWHWNGIVTQYTPLIGLKGIGLLNSYTVWTDRREDSPHRGYAFPSQQSEANFYGEDRAELITINKILVALDLIEIRKEMIRKVDAQGRRWKVPQNLYRVKDRQNGLDLTAADVLRVIELADRDQAVYRYIRKLFSTKFEPIDRDNVWHRILVELEAHPTWRKLADRAIKQEAKASARTKAGHRARAGRQASDAGTAGRVATMADDGNADGASDSAALLTIGHIEDDVSIHAEQNADDAVDGTTSADLASNGSDTADEPANRAAGVVDEPANDGFDESEGGSVAGANNGRASSVEQGNTTYYESSTTTTTTTGQLKTEADQERVSGEAPAQAPGSVAIARLDSAAAGEGDQPPQRGMVEQPGGGPLADPSPLVVSLYEAANDRTATRLERILLSELERDAAAPAAAAGSSGPDWVAAALREAVGSGSAFVAPKRVREIINRWSADGAGPRGAGLKRGTSPADIRHADAPKYDDIEIHKHTLDDPLDNNIEVEPLQISRADHEQGERLWSLVLDLLAAVGGGDELARLHGVAPLGQREDGVFLLGVPTRLAARLLAGRHRQPVERALSSLLASPVQIAVLDRDQWSVVD